MQTRQRDVETTPAREPGYYGLPVLKRPHWKWEIALYFWIGGIAAGAYVVATIADWFGDEADRATVRAGRLIALPLLILSPLLLIKDLGRPEKFFNMLRILKVKSPMSVGTWGLTSFGGIVGLSALLELIARRDQWRGVRRLAGLLGAPFGLFVGGYTGVLLSATAIPIWAKNRLLWGPAFLASAMSTGSAAIEVALACTDAGHQRALVKLERAHLFSLGAEAGLLAASLAKLGPTGNVLTKGKWSSLFVPGTAGLGITLPLALGLRRGHGGPSRGLIAFKALCILLGGLIFRFTVVYAGKDSADDPHAYFALTSSRTGHR